MKRFWFLGIVLMFVHQAGGSDGKALLPVPDGLEPRVQFWVDIFTKYSVDERIIHDAENPERIYRVVDFRARFPGDDATPEARAQALDRERREVVAILRRLGAGRIQEETLSEEALRIYGLFGDRPASAVFRRAARRVRIQEGMRETFREGVVRSGRYLSAIQDIFKGQGLPEALAYIPHVESSFNPHACSRFGALGIWQFTRSTGRQYLHVGYEMDERKDPLLSSMAAALFLKASFEKLGNWPLAVTAYNHGLAGMRRAVRRTGATDLSRIIREYRSRRFGFASKNFYAEVLAAVRVAQHSSDYFEDLVLAPPLAFKTFELPVFLKAETIQEAFGVTEAVLGELNPALRPPVFRGEKYVPRGYRLRLPADVDLPAAFASIEEGAKYTAQKPSEWYRVRRGETLSTIAGRFRTSVSVLCRLNDLSNPHRIREGQVLRIPPEDGRGAYADLGGVKISTRRMPVRRVRNAGDPSAVRLDLEPCLAVDEETIVVYPEETLGHYGEWLEIPTQRLRELNGLGYGQRIRVGQRLRLSFTRVGLDLFEERRLAYHRNIQEDFFEHYRIDDSTVYTIRPGETLWTLASQRFDVPLWLLMVHNGGCDPNRVLPGDALVVPVVARVGFFRDEVMGMGIAE